MILAKEKIDYHVPEQPQTHQPKGRKITRQEIVKHKLLSLAMVCCCFVMGMVVAYYYAQVAYVGYKIDCLQNNLADLRLESHGLEQDITKIVSLEHIENVAVNQLGMIKPDSDKIVLVSAQSTKPLTEVSAQQDTSKEQSRRESITLPEVEKGLDNPKNKIIQAFVQMVEKHN